MNSSNGVVVKEYPYGSVRQFNFGGYTFEAYVPNDVDSSTPVMLYEHGDGGYNHNWEVFQEKFSKEECNSIIIHGDRQVTSNIYNGIASVFNTDLTMQSIVTVSHSGGTASSLQQTAKIIKSNPSAKPAITAIMDGFIPTGWMESQGVVDTFKQNNTVVLGFCQSNNTNNYKSYYESFAKTGVNMLILVDNSQYGNSHNGINLSFVKSRIIEYLEGRASLPDNYSIVRYDAQSGKFVAVDYNKVATLDNLYSYFEIDTLAASISRLSSLGFYEITSDTKVINNYLNNIIDKIRKTDFLGFNFENLSGSSTTNVPTSVPSCVRKYFSSVSVMLVEVSKLVDAISEIDPAYQAVDKKLQSMINTK